MASYNQLVDHTDQGPKRRANFELSIEEADLVAESLEHTLENSSQVFSVAELMVMSRVKAVLDHATEWVEYGDVEVNDD